MLLMMIMVIVIVMGIMTKPLMYNDPRTTAAEDDLRFVCLKGTRQLSTHHQNNHGK